MKACIKKLCSLLFVASVLIHPADVSADMLDPSRESTLTLVFNQDKDIPDGGAVECIQVAYIDLSEPASPIYVYNGAFSEEQMPLVELNDPKTAEELNRYALEKNVEGPSAEISNGKADFGPMMQGLYLVRQKSAIPGFKDIAPFLISVPMRDELSEDHIYTVVARPKIELETTEESDNRQTTETSQRSTETAKKPSQNPGSSKVPSDGKKPSTQPKKQSGTNTGVFENPWIFSAAGTAAIAGLTILIRKMHSEEESE